MAKTMAKKRKKKRNPPKLCPKHGCKLAYSPNSYGSHWHCPEPGCSVRCWGGDTSTPGDAETFVERSRTHAIFDTLYGSETAVFRRREFAYVWLQGKMKLSRDACHIGMFNAEQCREAQRHVRELITRKESQCPD